MPVILENGSEEIRTWLDPKRSTWSNDLQSLLKPFKGELEVYPVSKDVGKVGNNSPTFIIPLASNENKSNIANFFSKRAAKKTSKEVASTVTSNDMLDTTETEDVEKEESVSIKHGPGEDRETADHDGTEDNAPVPVPASETKQGVKRELDDAPDGEQLKKVPRTSASPSKGTSSSKSTRKTKNATSNNTASPKEPSTRGKGSQKITSFFKK